MDNNLHALDSIFHALADTTRRAVIQRLGQGEVSVSDLARPFPMALPSFLKHLAVLETSGLIATSKAGRIRTCRLEPARLVQLENWLDAQRTLWQGRYASLDTLIATLKGDSN